MFPWSLVSYLPLGDERPRAGARLADGRVVQVPLPDQVRDLAEILSGWETAAPVLESWDPTDADEVSVERIVAPLRSPRKLICAGANYRDHLREMGIPTVPRGLEPYFFLLPPTTIIGPGDIVRIPAEPAAQIDWEAELAVVIGIGGHEIPVDRALDHVAGYTIMNDVSARGWLGRTNPLAPPFAYDWLGAKGSDTFSPLGPGITPSWFIPDPQDLRVRLWRNDQLEQDGNTRNMIFPVERLISAASRLMTLEPGDILATGTPAGVGAGSGKSLSAGDVLRVEIDPIGQLVNTVHGVAEPAPVSSAARSA